jgi:hypothetical protein
MHLLVILLQQLLGLLPNKQQAQPEPARVRPAQPGTPEQQAFQSSYGSEALRTGTTIFRGSTASAGPSEALLRALGGVANRSGTRRADFGRTGLSRTNASSVDGTPPVDQSRSPASPIALESCEAASPELRT